MDERKMFKHSVFQVHTAVCYLFNDFTHAIKPTDPDQYFLIFPYDL